MKCTRFLLLGAAAALASVQAHNNVAVTTASTVNADAKRCFPDDFLFGTATASYQVEGGWNETGRTTSIWDDFCRERPGLDCANVADDFLHRYRDDIDLMSSTGLDSFRFSISWSRLMNWDAETKKMKPNAPGIAFYHSLIDELRRKHIVPILTLYHWDLPSELHRELQPQGWINPAIVDHFVQYADLVFSEFGSKIDYWTTFNEPWSFIVNGYGTGGHAPGFRGSKTDTYIAAHNMLISHGKAVQLFRKLKKSGAIHDKARIGIVLISEYGYPKDPTNAADVAAASRKLEFSVGWFLTPLVSGKYPDIMRERVGDRLPEFTQEEAALVKGSYDLFMLNHYSSKTVTDCSSERSTIKCADQSPGWESDLGIDDTGAPEGARLSSLNDLGQHNCVWFAGYSPGYLEIIKWTHAHDPNADILLTENGWCGNDTIENMDQLWYYQTYLGQVHKAITEFKIPVIGYTAWSFVDNYEWGSFKPRFGLYYVNFTSQTGSKDGYVPKATDLARIPRPAAKWYQKVSETKCLDGFETESAAAGAQSSAAQLKTPAENDAYSSSSKTVLIVVLCVVVAVPAVAWLVKRSRRSGYSRV
uniref:Beta-glucosidase n=1 Tax=Globisporangium ultimum (strain ATCC 200006 / CBS 805.95 / DAOM BR144) TaxID=431595 RepID=K3X8D8_GLOUD